MKKAKYIYTARRRAALKRAQLISARKRSRNKKLAIAGAGVLAVGVGAAVIYGRKQKGREGNPIQVIKKSEAPPQARKENINLAKQTVDKPHRVVLRNKVPMPGDIIEFIKNNGNIHDGTYQTYEYGVVRGEKRNSPSHPIQRYMIEAFKTGSESTVQDGKIYNISPRQITGHRIGRRGISPSSHISDERWQVATLAGHRVISQMERSQKNRRKR